MAAGAAPILVVTSPVDGVCGCCGVCTTDFLGVCGVVAGATRFGGDVASATGAADWDCWCWSHWRHSR